MKTKLIITGIFLLILLPCLAQRSNMLADAKYITVGISGYVQYPGTYKLTPVDRLSDALAASKLNEEQMRDIVDSGVTGPDPKKLNPIPQLREDEDPQAKDFAPDQALRSITIIRNEQELSYDLLAFLRTGDISQNPFLRDGDQIHIPLIQEKISIQGSVGFPGELEFKAGDTIRKAVDMALGIRPEADLSAVRHGKYLPESDSFSYRNLDLSVQADLWETELAPGDMILIPENAQYRNRILVNVSGELMRKGQYSVPPETGLWELIQMAGGISKEADIHNAVLLNESFNQEPDADFERIKNRGINELTPLEYSYLRIKLRQAKGRYSVDFPRLFASEGKEGNVKLKNNDFLYIPQKLDMVWVSGQVKRPGLVSFKEGADWIYYVNQAGGYTSNRNKFGTRILRANSGNWIKAASDVEPRPGDLVFIPDKQDRHFWTDVKDIIGVTASAITILIGVHTLTK